MIWQPEFTDKTLSRKPGAVHFRKPVLRLFKDAIISLHPQVLEFLWWYNHLQSRLRSRPGPPLS
ncbi:hypothetical protein EFV03_25205 [Escherichia coli]|nr:hypothetical protein EFV15_25100 [Escherichia coli]RNI96127.1 hypothetical protein EFV05_25270 [Escherichia coli]RNJ11077.1 hypothetical protein EFV03_25205 [Escherichia coli]